MRKVKSHKPFGFQIQAVIGSIENIAVLVGVNPFEQLAAHISCRRKTAFIKVCHNAFFGPQIVKCGGDSAGNFFFRHGVVNQSNRTHPTAQKSAISGIIGAVKRI